jgi:hypothetical protein
MLLQLKEWIVQEGLILLQCLVMLFELYVPNLTIKVGSISFRFFVDTMHGINNISNSIGRQFAVLHSAWRKWKMEYEVKRRAAEKIERMASKKHAKQLAKINARKEAEQTAASREESRLRKARRESEKAKRLEAELFTMKKENQGLDSVQSALEKDVEAVMNHKREEKARKKAEKRERKAQQEQDQMLQRNAEQRRFEERKKEQMMSKLSRRELCNNETAYETPGSDDRWLFASQGKIDLKWNTSSELHLGTKFFHEMDAAEMILLDPITMQVRQPIRSLCWIVFYVAFTEDAVMLPYSSRAFVPSLCAEATLSRA